jgi:ornithine decarboxylase
MNGITGTNDELRFSSVAEVIERLEPSYPVFCIFPDILRARARAFVEGFPGTVLYAVKCNPHPFVLEALAEGGIAHFDTASITEIAKITELMPEARCYFNHPVKGRGALKTAADVYGIADYVVDHMDELDKLVSIAGTDITVEVRIATPKGKAVYDLSAKFGAVPDEAVALLKEAKKRGCRTALAFHVGSQCVDPAAFRIAMEIAARVRDAAGVPLDYLDVGGGFPAIYKLNVPPLTDYFGVIEKARDELGFDIPLLAEPGRALVADGCSVLTQVHLRKGDDLYINDGIYGCLSEIRDGDLDPPVRAISRSGPVEGKTQPFRIFGPTCDSLDVLKLPFHLPEVVEEGDWVEFGLMGAYSIGMQTGFNGFITDTIVRIDGMHEEFVF